MTRWRVVPPTRCRRGCFRAWPRSCLPDRATVRARWGGVAGLLLALTRDQRLATRELRGGGDARGGLGGLGDVAGAAAVGVAGAAPEVTFGRVAPAHGLAALGTGGRGRSVEVGHNRNLTRNHNLYLDAHTILQRHARPQIAFTKKGPSMRRSSTG